MAVTQLERDKLVAEWCRLVGKPISIQAELKLGRGRPQSGEAEAARQRNNRNIQGKHMLTIENGSCPSGSNSYADVTAADAWLGARGSGGWPPTPEVGEDPNFAAKEAALIRAADYLNGLNWRGKPVDGERIMAWPRVGVVTVHGHPISEDAVPAQVVAANCYLAGLILGGTDLQPILERGGRIQAEGIGSMRTTYFDDAPTRDTVSGLVDLVGGLLAPSDSGGKIVVAQMIRV